MKMCGSVQGVLVLAVTERWHELQTLARTSDSESETWPYAICTRVHTCGGERRSFSVAICSLISQKSPRAFSGFVRFRQWNKGIARMR